MLGLMMVLAGAVLLFYTFAWATLSGGGLPEYSLPWWKAVLGMMFDPEHLLAASGTGLFLIGYGMIRIVRGILKAKDRRIPMEDERFDPEQEG
jgi:hypothetical protein